MYYILNISAGLAAPDANFFPRLIVFARVQFVVQFFFYTTLFAVKLSFLFFFRRLGQRVQGQQYIWWPVLFFSVVSYVVSVGDIQFICELGPAETLVTYCNTDPVTSFSVATLKANCALDVFSDFLSMSKSTWSTSLYGPRLTAMDLVILIPISILWNVRIPWVKKAVFVGLFSLTLITIVVAIVRAVNISSSRRGTPREDTTFLWLWSAIQAPLGMIFLSFTRSKKYR